MPEDGGVEQHAAADARRAPLSVTVRRRKVGACVATDRNGKPVIVGTRVRVIDISASLDQCAANGFGRECAMLMFGIKWLRWVSRMPRIAQRGRCAS